MRIMLDTNIIISIVIFNSEKLKQLLTKICDNYSLVLSSYIIKEVEDVTKRKFPNKVEDIEKFLYKLPYEMEYVPSKIDMKMIPNIRDVKDMPVLYSAIVSDVDILITGDKDFEDVEIERPEIMTVIEFLEKY